MEENTTTEPSTNVEATVIDNGEQASETTYANGKFKTVSDLENSYTELQSSYSKKLGGFDGAPKEGYVYSEEFTKNDFIDKWGSENQLNQKGLESLVNGYTEYNNEQHAAQQAEQMKILGENGQERIENVAAYLRSNLGDEHGLDVQTAKGIEAIEKLIGMSKQSAPAQAPQSPTHDADQIKAMRFAVDSNSGERKMSIDPAYRAKVEALEAEMHKNRH